MNESPEGKFWEGPYPAIQARLKREKDLPVARTADDKFVQQEINRRNKLVDKIENMAEQLKKDGYSFELTDDQSEYLLRAKGFEGIIHITKVDDVQNVDIAEIIKDRIAHPER